MTLLETVAAALAMVVLAVHLIRQFWIILRDRRAGESLTVTYTLRVAAATLLLVHLLLLSVRRGFPAITAQYEALVLFALAILVVVQVVPRIRASRGPSVLSDLLALLLLLISSSPLVPYTVAPPVPALRSSWLIFHIVLAFLGEAFFTVGFVSSVLYLITKRESRRERFDRITYVSIAFGYVLFTLGALLFGAIWAYQSWGRYWAWDPKETWSLITWIVYSIYLHLRFVQKRSRKVSAITSIVGYGVMIFTLFGVNWLYNTLHAY
jgi:ABC-type transport system involved in cytochrome c biogenesis permease subunit